MKKFKGINYQTKRYLMFASVIIKAIFSVFLIISFVNFILKLDIIKETLKNMLENEQGQELLGNIDIEQLLNLTAIFIPIFIMIIFLVLSNNIYWLLKSKARYYASAKSIMIFQFINTSAFLIMPISSILMIIVAFTKDDDKDVKLPKFVVRYLEKRKNRVVLPKQIKKEIKSIKKERRKGIISSELCQKKIDKILKNNTK